MRTFILHADCGFAAEDLNDAFTKLIQHFTIMRDTGEAELFQNGYVTLYPINSALCASPTKKESL